MEWADYVRKQENKDQVKGDTPHHVRASDFWKKPEIYYVMSTL